MTIIANDPEKVNFLLPAVSGEIFQDGPKSRFWVGKVAVGENIENPEYYDGVARLRANVYIDEMRFLKDTDRDEFGREQDEYDARSIHFAVVENEQDTARIVGSGRLIQKTQPEDRLPIEALYPEVFLNEGVEPGAVEVSRFIARHEKDFVQHLIALSVIRAMTLYSVENDIPADYCVIEQPLYRLLSAIGLPMTVLADAKELEEYGSTVNIPVRIDPRKVIDSVTTDVQGKLPLTKFFKDEELTSGLGFYSAGLRGSLK